MADVGRESIGGRRTGSWVRAGSWDYSTPVATIDFLNLAQYQELAVFGKAITMAGSGYRFYMVSADNGASWISGSGKYTYCDVNGAEVDLFFGTPHFNPGTSLRTFNFRIVPWGVAGANKIVTGPLNAVIEDTQAHNAMRFSAILSDYSTPSTFTGGSLRLWGRIA